jgi:hypothetical protein
MTTTTTDETSAPPSAAIEVFRFDGERLETRSDFALDSRRRREAGQPPRDLLREPCRRRPGPWYSYTPFAEEPDAAPYARIGCYTRVARSADPFGEPLAVVHGATGPGPELSPLEAIEAAAAGRFGLRVVGGPMLDELGSVRAERAAADERRRSALEAEREARREAKAAELLALADAPTPTIGSTVLFWRREVFGAGHSTAFERLTPSPAVVFFVPVRTPGGPPPSVNLVTLDAGGATAIGVVPFAAEAKDGHWTWPPPAPAPAVF